MRLLTTFTVLLSLGGCSSFSANHFANTDHLKGEVKNEFFSGKDQYFSEYDEAFKCGKPKIVTNSNSQSSTAPEQCEVLYEKYRDRGIALVKSACEEELDYLADKHNGHNASKDVFIASSLLATGMMGINGASSDSFEKLALFSAFTVTMFDIRENYYLLGPNRIEIIEMVRGGLTKMTLETKQKNVLTFEDAYSQIRDVAYVCTNNQIDSLVKQSLEAGADSMEVSAIAEASLIQSYNRISEILDVSPLSDKQILGMFAYVRLGERPAADTDPNRLKALLGEYSTNLPTPAKSREIAEVFSLLPKAVIKKMKDEYNSIVKAAALEAEDSVAPETLSGSDIEFTLPVTSSSSLKLQITK